MLTTAPKTLIALVAVIGLLLSSCRTIDSASESATEPDAETDRLDDSSDDVSPIRLIPLGQGASARDGSGSVPSGSGPAPADRSSGGSSSTGGQGPRSPAEGASRPELDPGTGTGTDDQNGSLTGGRSLLERSAEPIGVGSSNPIVRSATATVGSASHSLMLETVRMNDTTDTGRESVVAERVEETRAVESKTLDSELSSAGLRLPVPSSSVPAPSVPAPSVPLRPVPRSPAPVPAPSVPSRPLPAPSAIAPEPSSAPTRQDPVERAIAVQSRLHELGYDPGSADGRLGQRTRSAIWAFQKVQGTTPVGEIDSHFLAQLRDPVVPKPLVENREASRIEIDIDRQLLVWWNAGRPSLISHMSSGNGREFCTEEQGCEIATTPVGDFSVSRRVNGWRTSYLGELYNPLYFMDGYAIHGSLDVPLGPVSRGCVRVPMHISEILPGLVPNGTPVYVIDR